MTTQPATLYHVAPRSYRLGDDLLSLSKRFPAFTPAVGARIVRKWPDLACTHDPMAAAADYYYGDGQEVHLYATLEEAQAHKSNHLRSGQILAIDRVELEARIGAVRVGTEFDHPVVPGSIPGDLVTHA